MNAVSDSHELSRDGGHLRTSWARPIVREGETRAESMASAQGVFIGAALGALTWAGVVAGVLVLQGRFYL